MAITGYKDRVWAEVRPLLASVGPVDRLLDFGAGDGWFSRAIRDSALARDVVPVEVIRRKNVLVEPRIYDGKRLPFADGEFDVAFAADVLHHCPDPHGALADMARCARRHVLIKDHTYSGPAGYAALCVMDELGNRRFHIPSLYKYQKGWSWSAHLESAGFDLVKRVHPAQVHVGLLGGATNHLQYVDLWRRRDRA